MRINDPLASFARFEREKNRVNLVCPANLKTAANVWLILRHVFGDGI